MIQRISVVQNDFLFSTYATYTNPIYQLHNAASFKVIYFTFSRTYKLKPTLYTST